MAAEREIAPIWVTKGLLFNHAPFASSGFLRCRRRALWCRRQRQAVSQRVPAPRGPGLTLPGGLEQPCTSVSPSSAPWCCQTPTRPSQLPGPRAAVPAPLPLAWLRTRVDFIALRHLAGLAPAPLPSIFKASL